MENLNENHNAILKYLFKIDKHFTNAIVIMNLCENVEIVGFTEFNLNFSILPIHFHTSINLCMYMASGAIENQTAHIRKEYKWGLT